MRIGTNVKYARFVHDGTGLYGPRRRAITAKGGGLMRWPVRGQSSSRRSTVPGRGRVTTRSMRPQQYAYARKVRGMRGTPFLRNALPAAA